MCFFVYNIFINHWTPFNNKILIYNINLAKKPYLATVVKSFYS
jgi:hypothetical protein